MELAGRAPESQCETVALKGRVDSPWEAFWDQLTQNKRYWLHSNYNGTRPQVCNIKKECRKALNLSRDGKHPVQDISAIKVQNGQNLAETSDCCLKDPNSCRKRTANPRDNFRGMLIHRYNGHVKNLVEESHKYSVVTILFI